MKNTNKTSKLFEMLKKVEEYRTLRKKLDYCTLCDDKKFKSIYYKQLENIKWIIWLDILGFKNIVSTWDKEKIFNLISFIKNFLSSESDLEEVYVFSDTIVAISSIGKKDLIFTLESLAILQIQLIDIFKLFIRGSISIGEVFTFNEFYGAPSKINTNLFIFGKGIINAYSLEQKAKYPIILLDENLTEVINLIDSLANNPKWAHRYPENYKEGFLKLLFPSGEGNFQFLDFLLKKMVAPIKIGKNSYYYIDYLKQLYNIEDNEDNITKFLKLHRKLLIKQYYATKHNLPINEKYKWLIHYYNSRVPRRFQVRIFKPERKISIESIREKIKKRGLTKKVIDEAIKWAREKD